MVTAYLLGKNGHDVTIFERQPILGGHIRSINKNVHVDRVNQDCFLESGVLEFPSNFYTVEAFRYRHKVIEENGKNNTYHVGAYLGDGLHEGAVVSAKRVAQLIGDQ
jgi:predicted NAD/FAD-binding protein